jgi:filamentous hemagglutinin
VLNNLPRNLVFAELKQLGVSVGNNSSFGGSVNPLFDPATNPIWGRTNSYNYFFGDKK